MVTRIGTTREALATATRTSRRADASLGREADERDDVGRHQEQDRDDATGPEVRILPGAFGGISISSHDGVGGVPSRPGGWRP
jgi:hypothetical protein